jgi:hypothetical protein
MKNAHFAVLAGLTLLFGLLPVSTSVADALKTKSTSSQIVVYDPTASDLNCPCEVESFVGNIYRYDQPVEKGQKLSSLDGIQFSTTKDVVVVTGTPKTSSFSYLVPRSYSSDARKLPCNSPLADCNPVVKNNLGKNIAGLESYEPTEPYAAEPEPATYDYPERRLVPKGIPNYDSRVEPVRRLTPPAASNIRLLIPHTPYGDYSDTAPDKFRYIRMQEAQ